MAKTIFLKVKNDDLDLFVTERLFRIERSVISKAKKDFDTTEYYPKIKDLDTGETFLLCEVKTNEAWEELKKIFTE